MKITYEDIKHLYGKNGKKLRAFCSSDSFLTSILYQHILKQTSFLYESVVLAERLYCIKENITEIQLCEVCHKNKQIYRNVYTGSCCNSCSQKNIKTRNKIQQTNLQKYGYVNSFQSAQTKKTLLAKYNVTSNWKIPAVIQKSKQTKLQKYGNANYTNRSKAAQTKLQKHGNANYTNRSKAIQTNLQKYNVSSILGCSKHRAKWKQKYRKEHGVDFHFQSHISEENFKKYNDQNWLREQIEILKCPAKHVAEELGILSVTNIRKQCKRFNIIIPRYYKFSMMCIDWLETISTKDNIHIQHALKGGEYNIVGTKYLADGYCKETNTIFEFYGDVWHGNLNRFKPNEKPHPFSQLTTQELYNKTIEREEIIKSLGYNIVSIWESEIKDFI